MPRHPRSPGGRSYDHYCAVARALDTVGDRWSLLVVRELLAGPRRYTDLHADLPGVSTDMLAARLRDLERDGIVQRTRLAPPAAGSAYAVTARGQELLPVVKALAGFGRADLAERRATDAVRAHWLAIPLLAVLEDAGVADLTLDVRTDEGEFHLRPGAECGPYGDGPAHPAADVVLELAAATCVGLSRGEVAVGVVVREGLVGVGGPRAAEFLDRVRTAETICAGTTVGAATG